MSDALLLIGGCVALLLILAVGLSIYRLFTWEHSDEWIDRELRKHRGR